MTVDLAELRDWLVVLQLLGTAATFVIALWLRARFVLREEFASAIDGITEELAAKHTRLERGDARFDQVERALAELPSKDDVHQLSLQLANLSGMIGVLGANLDGHKRLTDRLEDSVRRHEQIFAEGKR